MNKSELIEAMAIKADITKEAAKVALESLIESTTDALKSGEKVSLVGFGTLSVAQREARKGRNPQTGASIDIPAKKVIKFKAGSDLNSSVN